MLAAAALTVACSDVTYVRTNPYDLEANPTLTITGVPDSTFVLGASFTAKIESDMPFPTRPTNIDFVNWSGSGPLDEFVNGFFYVTDAVKVVPTEAMIIASFGDRLVTKTFWVVQRPVTLDVGCVQGLPCDTLRSIGDERQLRITGHDADGREIADITGLTAVANVTERTPDVLQRVLPAQNADWVTMRATANGTTWVVAERDGARDSIRVVVHQRLASWELRCPLEIQVGESLQLKSSDHVDARGNPMAVPSTPLTWFLDPFYEDLASLSEPGELTGLAPGDILVQTFAGTTQGPLCVITITEPPNA